MSRKPVGLWGAAAAALVAAATAFATTTRTENMVCPVCATRCTGVFIMSTNTFGGQDRDFLSRAAGSQPLLLVPTTCPKCHYSAYVSEFSKPVGAELKNKILVEKALVVPAFEAGEKGAMPAWVRHDLIGQVMKLKGAGDEELAWQHMKTAWAVRMEDEPFAALLAGLGAQEREWLSGAASQVRGETKEDNRALVQVRVARGLVANLGGYPAERRRAAAIFAGGMLRDYGEHEALSSAMAVFKPLFAAEEWAQLEKRVTDSVALERRYQQQALALLEAVLPGLKGKDAAEKKAMYTYVAGEVSRRLGDGKKALHYFDVAAAAEGRPAWLADYIREQRGLAAEGSPAPKDAKPASAGGRQAA